MRTNLRYWLRIFLAALAFLFAHSLSANDAPNKFNSGFVSTNPENKISSGFVSTNPETRELPQIPGGTILPVRLNRGVSSRNARPGQAISARLMQDVPLPNGGKLPAGARVSGTILAVAAATKTGAGGKVGGSISFRFSEITHGHSTLPIAADLRAIASLLEVEDAQLPETPAGFGTPYNWTTTHLVGGDEKYGVGGPVTDSDGRTIGTGTPDGVLVHVRAMASGGCRGELGGENRLQALWVFSSDACGVYGVPGVRLVHAGRTARRGEITLSSEDGDVLLRSGYGLLLRVQ